LLRELEDVTVV